MRLFVGCPAGPTVAAAAAVLAGELRQRAAQMDPQARISWVAPDKIHVTLAFIGQADEARVAAVCAALDRPFDVGGFEAAVEGVGVFPPRGAPRVIWAGVTTGRDQLASLHDEVRARLAGVVRLEEERAFRPHFTLARVKAPGQLRARRLLAGFEDSRLGSVRVDAVTLFDSRPAEAGPVYVPLHRVVLG